MTQLILAAVAFVIALVILSAGFEYWYSRRKGMSHDEAVHDSVIAGGFLSGSAAFGYVVGVLF